MVDELHRDLNICVALPNVSIIALASVQLARSCVFTRFEVDASILTLAILRGHIMKRIVLTFIIMVLLAAPAISQVVAPYPDTSPTGDPQQDLSKLKKAQSDINQANEEMAPLQKHLGDLGTMMGRLQDQHRQLGQRADAIIADWTQKKAAFNSACTTHDMVIGGAEWSNCQRWRQQAEQEHDAGQAEENQLAAQAHGLEVQYQQLQSDQTLTAAKMQKLRNYISQVQSGIRTLEVSVMGQCKNLLQTAGPEELKVKCGNVQFDGANGNLPLCKTEDCLRARVGSWQ